MSPTSLGLERKKGSSKRKRTESFPWLGLVLVVLGLGLIFYFIGSPDINKIDKSKSSSSFLEKTR